MTDQTPLAVLTGVKATLRIEIYYAPDQRFHVDPLLEAALVAENVEFALHPAAGDTFILGTPSRALYAAGLGVPRVIRVEHAPALPSESERGYASVIVHCTSDRVPTDETLAACKEEGWLVNDFRHQHGHGGGNR